MWTRSWSRCLREVARHSHETKCPSNNNWPLLPENVSGNIHYSSVVGALPNGRRLGDALYDGGISPGPGLDRKGPTAVLRSCGKFDHITDGRAFLLNQRLSPTQLSGEKGYQLWRAYMKTWADLGLDHVQFNMVDDRHLEGRSKRPGKVSGGHCQGCRVQCSFCGYQPQDPGQHHPENGPGAGLIAPPAVTVSREIFMI